MLSRIKQYLLIALAAGLFYFLLSHHFIFFSFKDFVMLKKVEPTLEYTFFSIKQAHPLSILRIDPLRDAGIEEVMLERGMLTEARLDYYLDRIDKEQARPEK